jgi:replicative DNA helicase
MIDMATEQRRRSVPLTTDQLPRSVDAETALLDAALYSTEARDLVLALPPGAMTIPSYQPIVQVMKSMAAAGAPPDQISLLEAAAAMGMDRDAIYETIKDVDGASMADAYAPRHAKIIRERYEQRLAIQRVHAALELMVTKPADTAQITRTLVSTLIDFAAGDDTGFVQAARAMVEAYDASSKRAAGDLSATIRTGVTALDEDPVGGLEPGDLVTLVMVSGHGKTAAMAMIAARAAMLGTGVGFVSAEMARRQIALRWAALLTGIAFRKLKAWDLNAAELARATYAMGVMEQLPLYIDDAGTPSLGHVVTQVRRLVQRHPEVRIVCIDYLTLIQGNAGNSTENHNQVVRTMKRLAKEMQIVIIGLVQPDARTIEKRGDEEQMPRLDDIAWCQEFRNQSDLIICGYRHGKALARHGGTPEDSFGAFRVAKSRNGGVAEWTWKWNGPTMAFDFGCWHQLDAMTRGDAR